eukprot:scaffold491131_cov22-Prasinocladus_malaysianus.AAC.1
MSWQTKTDRTKDKHRRIVESFDSIADVWAAGPLWLMASDPFQGTYIDPPDHFTAHIFRELYA